MIKQFVIATGAMLVSVVAFAQDSRNIGKKETQTNVRVSPKNVKSFNNYAYNVYYDKLVVEYKQRMQANVHKHKVMARKMRKPQYSDPSYFGHKHKPKIRPVGKRKFCQECGIVH